MSKIVQINATCGIGSTGKICVDISKKLTEAGIENYILYSNKSNGYEKGIRCSTTRYTKLQAIKSHLFGNYGFNSNYETRRMIKQLQDINPDIVHLHNIHGHDCNLKILFDYLKKSKCKIVWTFHDCWAFTGYCPHFIGVNCNQWKNGCEKCRQYKDYSFFLDRSKKIYQRKKELFSEIDLTIVTPSQWLANLVRESFLQSNTVNVIHNGIDLEVFKPTVSSFKEKYNIESKKKIILGVAFDWGIRKGLDVFIELSKVIDSEKYQIVLVGTNDEVDKQLPKNILSIHRTQNQKELAELYSVADVFLNPTREDNFPTVNIEAMACGTPVITFDTGGSPESLTNETGVVISDRKFSNIIHAIRTVCNDSKYSETTCVKNVKRFEKNLKYEEYLKLYESILNT